MASLLRQSSHNISRYFRWGILGTGRIAEDFVTALKLVEDAVVVACASSVHIERGQQFAEKFKIGKFYGTVEGLVTDPDVEIVYVASVHPHHKDGALAALRNGKHVLCEKPFTMNEAEAEEVVNFAREKKLFVMEAMWTRHFPIMHRVRALIKEGRIGRVTSLQASFGFKADPNVPRLGKKDLGAGALLDVGIYVVSLASMLFGGPQGEEPTEVRAIGELDEHGIDQQAGIIIGFKKGIAILQTSFNADLPNEATIIGTEGRLKIHKPLWCPTRISWHLQNGETDEEDFPLPRVDGTFNFTNSAGLHYEAKHVQQCIYQHKTESEIMPLAETLTIMKTMDAIRNQIGLIYK